MSGTESQYAAQKMMMLSEKVRPCDRRRRPAALHPPTAGINPARHPPTRNMASSSSPRQLRQHRVLPTPPIDLSAESSSVTNFGVSLTHRPVFMTSLKTGNNHSLCSLSFDFVNLNQSIFHPSVLLHCWLRRRKGIFQQSTWSQIRQHIHI